jgi:formylglycine-generating enzyme required for sulfatase activity
LLALLLAVAGGVWKYWTTRRNAKSKDVPDSRDAKARYLDYIITAHQHLPVAGFETNLRVPIPLEKVYVSLQARMAEIDRARDGRRGYTTGFPDLLPDRMVTVQEALQFALGKNYDGVVILGQPGSGKTTLAKYFLLCFATNKAEKNLQLAHKLLPILLFLREIDPEKSCVENILAALQKHQLGLDEKFFLPYLQKGEAILLLDGLDEVPTEEKRQRVSQWIHQQVHLTFPRCPVIVTSRFSGYRGGAVLPGYYLRLEIQDYQLQQVKQFLENWLTAVETHVHEDNRFWRNEAKQKAEDLHRRLEETKALRELAVNPLMLQIIALVHRDRGTLPERRIELYKECTDVLLERWDKAKNLPVPLSAAEARQLLQPVALWMHSVENRREVSKQEILAFIASILPRLTAKVAGEDLLKSWQERSGIFKGEGETYFFHHLSFQEYLTAEEIRNTRQVEVLVKNFDKAWWREPTLLAMGLTNPPIFSDFMNVLLRAPWSNGARVDFMLRCIDETLVKDEKPFVEGLKRLKRTEARYHALCGLERIGTEQAKAAVRQALHDKDEQIASTARTILAKWGETPVEEKIETIKTVIKGKVEKIPQRLFNPVELNAEYILIPGAKEKIIFESTKKPAPDYPLYFAKYPVTNKLYRRFIDYLDGKNKEALANLPRAQFEQQLLTNAEMRQLLGNDSKQWLEKFKREDDKRFSGDDQPVSRVSWYGATAYCQWLTLLHQNSHKSKSQNESYIFRLPIEEEWEWAASGGKRKYPWGEKEPDETRANYGEKVGHTTPVGAYPAGATPEGLMDMAGNVWEWCENLYGVGALGPDVRALRGGSWDYTADVLRCAARGNDRPVNQWYVGGFRVVYASSHSF